MSNWQKCDAWFRRDIGGASLTVSRAGRGCWAWVLSGPVGVIAKGTDLASSQGAMLAADQYVTTKFGVTT